MTDVANTGERMDSPPDLAAKGEVVPFAQAAGADKAEMERCIGEVDFADSHSIIAFGSKAQGELRTVTGEMLSGVKNKDTGPAGDLLNDMVLKLRGFDLSDLASGKSPGFFGRLLGMVKPLAKAVQRYESVDNQIKAIARDLEKHKSQMLRDIAMLDRLYDASVESFHSLESYIAAGTELLRRLDEEQLPRMKAEAGDDVLKVQEVNRLAELRNDLERRLHDLKLTRQVTMQSIPSLSMVQNNDKSLASKIDSTLTNTIPLWETQVAQALVIHNSQQAASAVRAANDLTNELLEANAENLKQANAETRRQVERGIFDIESIERANRTLIETIRESQEIFEEGKRARADAEKRLAACEAELKETLREGA